MQNMDKKSSNSNLHKAKTDEFYTQLVDIEKEVKVLMQDEDVTKKSGIYPYLLTGKERYLSIRTFTSNVKREAYERQNGICPICKNKFSINEMEADHINPWSKGGKTIAENCQMLCKEDNRIKSGV